MSEQVDIKQAIKDGKTSLGIEMGSTRIKAVLIDDNFDPIASGSHDWENRLEGGIWTYHIDDVWKGLQDSFSKLSNEVYRKYGVEIKTIGSIGFSAMMHGYMVFDKTGKQLVPFRTWRNTITEQAASRLTKEFKFNIPQRWSIAHLYQAILNNEPHVKDISIMTTLAGYVHWKLTGEKVLGVGEAAGVFPIDSNINDYNQDMINKFNSIVVKCGYDWKLNDILPKVLIAGESAGVLTKDGALLLDPTGKLQSGVPLCPPEGDAGTGMTATNSVAERTGNVSAGTSIFAMVVLEKELSNVYAEIDMVTTPAGKPVAMVHCNNCTSDLDAWVKMFNEVLDTFGTVVSKPKVYDELYFKALEGDGNCGGLLSYNYYSGEPITKLDEGRPLFVRMPDSKMTLANFMRTLLFSTMATLKIGMDILTEKEHVRLRQLMGHGGLFKTKDVGQNLMASAMNVPVVVMESAGEGGAWGIALLAAYMKKKNCDDTLEKFLEEKVFHENQGKQVKPDENNARSFTAYMERYRRGIRIEKEAVENLK